MTEPPRLKVRRSPTLSGGDGADRDIRQAERGPGALYQATLIAAGRRLHGRGLREGPTA